MKTAKTLLALALLVSLVACDPVPSLYPLFKEDEVVFEPELLGEWGPEADRFNEDGEDARVAFKFEKSGDRAYKLTMFDDKPGSRSVYEVHLARLGGYLFLDAVLQGQYVNDNRVEVAPVIVPAHLFGRIEFDHDTLRIAMLDDEWLAKAIEDGRVQLRHEKVGGDILFLIAPTADLQEFAMHYATDEEAFSLKTDEMHRVR